MPLLFYCAVLAIVLGNVLFGLDWMSAPMSPMPETASALQSAPAAAPSAPVSARPATLAAPAVAGPDAAQQADAVQPEKPAQLSCNVDACTRAYRSFHASDCTYLPTGGPRRRCEK